MGVASAFVIDQHAALAEQVGAGAVSGQIFLLESGHPVEFTADGGAFQRDPVTAGRVCVDSGSLEEIEDVVIRDRKHLSEDGVVVPIIAIDKHTGKMESQPEIVTRGMFSDNGQETDRRSARSDYENGGAIERGRKIGLGRHQGKDSCGPQAVHQ